MAAESDDEEELELEGAGATSLLRSRACTRDLRQLAGEEGEEDEEEKSEPENAEEEEEDAHLQRKLHLFRSTSVQVSMTRLWDLLPLNDDGELAMDGYVELNLRLQKCLTRDFVLERAVDSAIGDWSEDVREGQKGMPAEEFGMFLFELCSLWCGPGVACLRAYLLFLNACFVAITVGCGSHTVGLKPVDGIERLPKAFFDLLALQGGWGRARPAEPDPDEAFRQWYTANLEPTAEQQAMLQVQRQVFQVTQDVRSVFLFRQHDGREPDDHDTLDLVRRASHELARVLKGRPPKALLAQLPRPEHRAPSSLDPTNLTQLAPWCPATHSRIPGVPLRPSEETAVALAAVGASAARRRNHSAPSRPPQPQALVQRAPERPEPVPVGRAFETVRAKPKGRGLVLAGQATIARMSGVPPQAPRAQASGSVASDTERYERYETESVPWSRSRLATGLSDLGVPADWDPTASADGVDSEQAQAQAQGRLRSLEAEGQSVESLAIPSVVTEMLQRIGLSGQEATVERSERRQAAPCLDDAHFLPPYQLPRRPEDLYHRQASPLMATKPSSIVFGANKFQAEHRLVPDPFNRALRKLSGDIRPPAEGPDVGPLGHAGEPIWGAMNNRLQLILDKQARRTDRRRKRRIRSKLQRGRSGKPKRSEGRELREYLDRCAAERAQGVRDPPGVPSGEFLGKVHERYQQHRERLEQPRFCMPSAAGRTGVDRYIHPLGTSSPRAQCAPKPVYIPPQAATRA